MLGLFVLITNSLVLYGSFLHAYFFNDFMFSVHINLFGESHIELIVLTLVLIVSVGSTIKLVSYLTAHPENIP